MNETIDDDLILTRKHGCDSCNLRMYCKLAELACYGFQQWVIKGGSREFKTALIPHPTKRIYNQISNEI